MSASPPAAWSVAGLAPQTRLEAVVDVAMLRHNVRALRGVVQPGVAMMTVVKADGYGHGMSAVARAAREAGSEWLGVATLGEALALRAAGDTGRVLCWLTVPGETHDAAVRADVDVTAYSPAEVAAVADAAGRVGGTARLQLKVDTGLSRGGATEPAWPALLRAARRAEREGRVVVTGVWSHLAAADEPGHPANEAQEAVFEAALDQAEAAGLRPEVRHLANSAATLLRPSAHYDLVRCGIATYGLHPALREGGDPGLVPAMTVRGRLALTKALPAGAGVSYGHAWTAPAATTVGLVPAGYGDGVPRHASSAAEVLVAGRRRPVRGRVCMDQLVVDLGGERLEAGEPVVLFGSGADGEPTAHDWAEACGTITYEIVSRIGGNAGRMVRRHVDSVRDPAPATPQES